MILKILDNDHSFMEFYVCLKGLETISVANSNLILYSGSISIHSVIMDIEF